MRRAQPASAIARNDSKRPSIELKNASERHSGSDRLRTIATSSLGEYWIIVEPA